MLSLPIMIFIGLSSLPAYCKESKRLAHPTQKFLIVIDPGHGGPDTGAVYKEKGTIQKSEKDFTLLLARDLARELIIRGNNVILTRNEDRDIPLSDRTALANRLKADVFISLHFNSSNEKLKSGGSEVFILNHATDETSKRLADLENAVLKESSAKENGGSGNVSLIMKDLILDGNLEPSREMACAVQSHLKTSTKDRGVKQALFYVLLGTDMPSILIEAGFMNATQDREKVINSRSRLKMVVQIASGIEDYKLKRTPTQCKVLSEKLFKRADEPRRGRRKI